MKTKQHASSRLALGRSLVDPDTDPDSDQFRMRRGIPTLLAQLPTFLRPSVPLCLRADVPYPYPLEWDWDLEVLAEVDWEIEHT